MQEGLRLITDRPARLEHALARDVKAAQADDPLAPVAVLLGGTLQRPYLQRRLAERNGGIVNVHFLMPSELALLLGERAQTAAGRRPLPPLADRILLREIALRHESYFAPVRQTPGFADALFRLVRELRGAGYDANSFERAVTGACETPTKDGALADLLARFLRRRANFYGPDDCILTADPDLLDAKALAVHGIWEVPAALRRCVEAIADRMPVTVYLPATGTDADDAHADLREWLAAVGAVPETLDEVVTQEATPERSPDGPAQLSLGADAIAEDEAIDGGGAIDRLDAPQATTVPAGLSHLRDRLFRTDDDPAPAPLDGSVTLLSGPDPSREVREVARTCLAWAREGIRFYEMAIVYRHADEYRPLIEAVFREADIPLYLHEGTPLIERPVGRRVAALLDLAGSNLERRAAMDFLTDAELPRKTRAAYGDVPASRWDKLSREAGVVEGAAQWDERLRRLASELAGEPDDEDVPDWKRADAGKVEDLRRFVADLDQALRHHPGEATWSEQLAALRRLLERYVKDPSAVLDALRPLERFDALGESVSFDHFREVVRGALESLRSEEVLGTRPGRFGARGVNVLDANSARHVSFRAVAVVGLSERAFPPPPRQDPLLLDHERERLNARGFAPIPLRARGADPEPLQFALAAGAAREHLLLTYPRKSAGEGRPQLPSSFFRAAARAMVGRAVRASEIDSLPSELYRRAPGSRIGAPELEQSLSAAERDRTLIEHDGALGKDVLRRAEPRIERVLEARKARLRPALTPVDGALSPAARAALEAALLPPDRPFSPTSIESYATCPQRFFLDRLRAQPVEEPEATTRISAMHRGGLIHRVLERFMADPPAGDATGAGELLHGPGEPERLQSILTEECDAAEARGETGYELMWRYDREDIAEDLRGWLESERADPSFRELPDGAFEVRFGRLTHGGDPESPLSSDEPLAVGPDGARLLIHGRIDRLNWNPESGRFRVVDYKTGKVYDDHADNALGGGRALQLPLYLLAGAQLTGIDAEAGSAEYHFPTRRGQYRRRGFSGTALAERRVDLDRLLAGLIESMRAGSFQMAPVEGPDTCRWCPFDGLCPTARHSQMERKQDDPRARAIAELREIE